VVEQMAWYSAATLLLLVMEKKIGEEGHAE
jgi:hypothetical protein